MLLFVFWCALIAPDQSRTPIKIPSGSAQYAKSPTPGMAVGCIIALLPAAVTLVIAFVMRNDRGRWLKRTCRK
jgi:hypothetical protein